MCVIRFDNPGVRHFLGFVRRRFRHAEDLYGIKPKREKGEFLLWVQLVKGLILGKRDRASQAKLPEQSDFRHYGIE